MKTVTAYPLQWPDGWKRTPNGAHVDGKFGKRTTVANVSWKQLKDVSVANGVSRVRAELVRMRISEHDIVISTNLKLRLDGFPRSDQAEPLHSGACVYWIDGAGEMRCMAIDRYNRVADNLAAIAATLEAMRAIERHGGAEILNRAYAGFLAIGHDSTVGADWPAVLRVDPNASQADIEEAFKLRRREAHPDRGGSDAEFDQVNKAYEFATRTRA